MFDASVPLTADPLSTVRVWRHGECPAAGDRYLELALRCYAFLMLSISQMMQRILDRAGVSINVYTPDRYEAAWLVARHCAQMDLPLGRIIAMIAGLGTGEIEVPMSCELISEGLDGSGQRSGRVRHRADGAAT